MPHGSHNDLFSQVSNPKEVHDKSKENFEKAVIDTAAQFGYTPKKIVNQAKEDSKNVLEKNED